MSLRIGFDLDGVLADMDGALARHAEALFGDRVARRVPSPEPEDEQAAPETKLDLSPRQQHQLWQHVQSIDDFWETLGEIEPGAVARLGEMALERRWEVIFITRRPESFGATPQVQSQRWLQAKGFELPSVFVVQGSRGRVAAALDLDIVVDDRVENCLDVTVDSSARAILIWREEGKDLPAASKRLGIGIVRSVAECLDVLARADSRGSDQPGLVTRVMRALGLKEDTPA